MIRLKNWFDYSIDQVYYFSDQEYAILADLYKAELCEEDFVRIFAKVLFGKRTGRYTLKYGVMEILKSSLTLESLGLIHVDEKTRNLPFLEWTIRLTKQGRNQIKAFSESINIIQTPAFSN